MNTKHLTALHEKLGNEYLDTMKAMGVESPPTVGWSTGPDGRTRAFVFFDECEDEVAGCPVDMLVSMVVMRVKSSLASGRN